MTDKIQAVFINFSNQKCFVVNLRYKKKNHIYHLKPFVC